MAVLIEILAIAGAVAFAYLHIRAYEGFSARAAGLHVGTRFQVDGPHGAFRVRARTKGVLLLT